MLALAMGLRRHWDVTVAAVAEGTAPGLLRRALSGDIAIWRLPAMSCSGGGARLETGFARLGFDVVHVHAGIGWEGHALARAARLAHAPLVIRTEHLPYLITDPSQRAAHARGLTWVDDVICVSAAVAASHRDLKFQAGGFQNGEPRGTGPGPARMTVIRNGIAPAPACRPRAATRAALGLSGTAPVIITVARLTAQKDHATLLAAAPGILAARPDTRFLLVGEGPEDAALRHIVEQHALGAAVSFLGRSDDVPDLLAAADLMVLPSLFEGLPLAVLEAMAQGLPVAGTRIGGTDEAIVDGLTGHLFETGDAAGLARIVNALLADPPAARALGQAGKTRFERHFHAARMVRETHRLYLDGLRAMPRAVSPPAPSPPASSPLVLSPSIKAASMHRVRLGFIGAGGIAQRHLGVLEQFEDVTIAAFADTTPGRAASLAARFGAHAYESHRAMLDACDLDAVYICVPPFAHGEPERDVLRRGLPFFVEKPLSLDLPVAEAVAREVAGTGLVTAVGYHWRYLDTVDEARALLAGAPAQLITGYWLDATPPPAWWWKQAGSGGQMVEQTTHVLDLARYLVGEVGEVFGLAGHLERPGFPGLDVATASGASLKFVNGAIGTIASTCVLRWGHRIGLHLFSDGLAIEMTDRDIMIDRGQGRPVRPAHGDPVWREDRDFIDAVKGGPNRIRSPYAEALRTHRLALAITRSAASGLPVRLDTSGHLETAEHEHARHV